MRITRAIAAAALLCALSPAAAFADITAFIGVNTTPANRQVRGAAGGISLLIVAFEFEYAFTPDDPSASAPSLKTGMGNVLLQTPFPVAGFQPYVTGGGVKLTLIGPLRLRVDYRVFKLGSGALNSPAHRVYVGLNLNF